MNTEEKTKAYDEDERMRKIISDILLTDSDEIREILDANNVLMQDIDTWLEKRTSNIGSANKEYWRGYREGKQEILDKYAELEKQGKNIYNKELSELLNKVICRFINNPEIPYSDREKVSMKVIPYVELLEKQGEKNLATDFSDLRTWEYIVDAVWTEKEGMGQYLDRPFTEEIAKKLQKRFGNIEQKSVEKLEPKFHEGEWVVNRFGDAWHIDSFDGKNYQASNFAIKYKHCYFPIEKQNEMHLWSIQDAKTGDVLFCKGNIKNSNGIKYEIIYLFNNLDNAFFALTKNSNYIQEYGIDVNVDYPDNTVLATKEQKEILFMAMADAGYTFDFEKKELKKIEPKFHKGEWITNGDYTWKIIEIRPLVDYTLQSQDGSILDDTISHVDEQFHSFTIQDAKDGDVLYMNNGLSDCIFIYKSSNNTMIYKHASYNKFGFEGEHYLVLNDGYVCPATKKERDALMEAITDAGYTFDFEKKELKKIEPKFHEGEWIVLEKKPCQIINTNDKGDYIVQYCDDEKTHEVSKKFCESYFHLWTIQDAKDGDILSTEKGRPFIFRGLTDRDNPDSPVAYCGIDSIDDFYDCSKYNDSGWTYEKVFPATIEQHSLLFQKMKEARYEWDAEKKELKKIVAPIFHIGDRVRYKGHACDGVITEITNTDYICGNAKLPISTQNSLEIVEQKLAWSEEDERNLSIAIQYVFQHGYLSTVNWLKSLKDKMQPQNLTVTDEELAQAKKNAYNDALDKIEYHSGEPTFDDGWHAAINCILKNSIIPQTTWKPTEAQLTQLGTAVSKGTAGYFNNDVLRELYAQLKQL